MIPTEIEVMASTLRRGNHKKQLLYNSKQDFNLCFFRLRMYDDSEGPQYPKAKSKTNKNQYKYLFYK